MVLGLVNVIGGISVTSSGEVSVMGLIVVMMSVVSGVF